MNYVQDTKLHSYIFAILVLFVSVSPPYNQGSAGQETTKEATGSMATGVVETIQNNGKTDTKKTKFILIKPNRHDGLVGKTPSGTIGNERNAQCNQECKINTLTGIGVRQEIAISLVENCKALAEDPRKCVIAGASIVTSESSGGWNCRKNNKYNCFGIMQNNNYKSYNDATLHFAGKFQKWWRNAKSASFFYPSRGQKSPSRFCVSEHSSNSVIGCPNGQKNAQIIWDKLEKKF